MTSTEFTIGLDGNRNSSKVLRPPGGGSSDIFGLGATSYLNTNGNKDLKNQETTTNRLFGAPIQSDTVTPCKPSTKTSFTEKTSQVLSRSTKKAYVRRNPITGEETIVYPETEIKNVDKDEAECPENGQKSDEEKEEVLQKPVQTSIRIRNPPGGKSSGIF